MSPSSSIVVMSDLHLGDRVCALVSNTAPADAPKKQWALTEDYQRMVAALREHDAERGGGGIDYLVLMGDVLDFSVASQGDAYGVATVFFQALAAERTNAGAYLVKEIIYTPGNHDFQAWTTIMHQANVVNRLNQRSPVIDRWSSPGLIDFRTTAGARRGRLYLPKVSVGPGGGYGGLFLDALTRVEGRTAETEPRLIWNVAYPNLYVIDDQRTTLLTHGHYMEGPWAASGQRIKEIADEDLRLPPHNHLSVDDLVSLNLPFAELTSASLGMSGRLVPIAGAIQREFKEKASQPEPRLPLIRKYLHRVRDMADRAIDRDLLTDRALNYIERKVISWLSDTKAARHDKEFPEQELVQLYQEASGLEREMLAREHDLGVPEVTHLLLGHSHEYVPWGSGDQQRKWHDAPVHVSNTGGWLRAHETMQGGIFSCDFDGERADWSSQLLQ